VAYWYQTEPHKAFPALPAKELRVPKQVVRPVDIHRWRDSWRKEEGYGPTLWRTGPRQ